MSFGVTAQGFVRRSLAEIIADAEDRFRTAFGANTRVDARALNGQLIGIFGAMLDEVWQASEGAYASNYLASATGQALADLLALAGITPLAASFSVVELEISGDDGTVIPLGSVVEDPEGNRWLTAAAVTISGGTAIVDASPETTGPIVALAGTLTVISTPLAGWDAVTNPLDAVLGRDAETAANSRRRFDLTMRAGGGSSVEAVVAAILRLQDVSECIVIENQEWFVDADGRPAKSFETVVRGGDDQAIVDAIWFGKPGGIETAGSETGVATDAAGNPQTVLWSRPIEVDLWLGFDITFDPGTLDPRRDEIEAEIVAAVLDFAASYIIGQDVVPLKIIQQIESTGIEVLGLRIGTAASPTQTTKLEIGRTSLAVFDSSRITFTRAN